MFAVLLLNRVFAFVTHATFHQTLMVDFLLLMMALGTAAVTIDRRLVAATLVIIVGAFAAAIFPRFAVEAMAGVVLAMHIVIAILLRPGDVAG